MEPVEDGRILIYRNKDAFLAECHRRSIKKLMIDAKIHEDLIEKTVIAEDTWSGDILILKTYEIRG